jgi:hypothetical protein
MNAQRALFAAASAFALLMGAAHAQAPITPSPAWNLALPDGPDTNVKITEAYARMVARDAYFWAWPMINIYNRRLAFKASPGVGLMNGVLPFAPLNMMSMLHDYIQPEQRWVACPNQDVAYGAAVAALDETPVVVQVPDFGSRFWVYQVVDIRTDSFAEIGAMYGTRTGPARCRKASRACSGRRPGPPSWCLACSWMTRRKTGRPFRRSSPASTSTRSPSSTER